MVNGELDNTDKAMLLLIEAAHRVGLPGLPIDELALVADNLQLEGITDAQLESLAAQIRKGKQSCQELLKMAGIDLDLFSLFV